MAHAATWRTSSTALPIPNFIAGRWVPATAGGSLPVLDPAKINVPAAILRGVWDGIATDKDLLDFFSKLPNPDKQFTVMPGIAHTSLRSKNWRMVYDLIDSCCSRTGPVYTGKA